MIGNPIIADLSIQPGGIGVITGKGYGATNVIVMDATGAVLMEKSIEVKGPSDPTVVVYRGVNRNTYSCTPVCEPRITLGDDLVLRKDSRRIQQPQHPGIGRRRSNLRAYLLRRLPARGRNNRTPRLLGALDVRTAASAISARLVKLAGR